MAQTRLKPKLLRIPQHFLDTNLGIAELMPDLSWITSNPVEAKQHDKTGQSLVCRAGYLRVHVDLDSGYCANNRCSSQHARKPGTIFVAALCCPVGRRTQVSMFSDWRSAACH